MPKPSDPLDHATRATVQPLRRADPPLRPGETKADRRALGVAALYSFQWRDPSGHWHTTAPQCYTSARIARFRRQLEILPEFYTTHKPAFTWQAAILSTTRKRGRPPLFNVPPATPKDMTRLARRLNIPRHLAAYLITPSTP